MKIAILHLSDIHFNSKCNYSLDKLENLISSCRDDIRQCAATFVITTGDIAFSGQADEYDIALTFYGRLLDFFKENNVKVIVAPGNHDCDFSIKNSIRDNLIKNIISNSVDIDSDIINLCCSVQDNYINFANCLYQSESALPTDKLLNITKHEVNGKLISIASYNTSWLSCINEKYGNIYFPVERYSDELNQLDSELVISIMHHPFSWQGPENNRLMAKYIENTSSIVLTGHEHHTSISFKSDMLNSSTEYIQGAILQDNMDSSVSGFNFIIFDLSNKKQLIKEYVWSENSYDIKNPDSSWFSYRYINGFDRTKNKISVLHEKYLTDTGMMLNHAKKTDILLDDIYVYPNFRDRTVDNRKQKLEHIVNLKELLSASQSTGKYIIFGSEKSGKTALSKHIFSFYHKKGFIPVLVDGRNISASSTESFFNLLNSLYKKQYENHEFSSYSSVLDDKRVIIIDDFDNCRLNQKHKYALLNHLNEHFNQLILTVNESFQIGGIAADGEIHKDSFKDYYQFDLLQFGHALRNELVTRWNLLGQELEIEEDELVRQNDKAKTIIDSVIGKNLVPSYPIFLLTLLQSFEAVSPHNLKTSSQGYYYDYLIIQSLGRLVKRNDEIDAIYSYITELSFTLFSAEQTEITKENLLSYHQKFCKDYSVKIDFNDYLNTLVDAKILDCLDDVIKFKYRYIYYFFVARYLATNIHEQNIKDIISRMCKKLYLEEYANIFMFLTHHSKDPFILNEILVNSKRIFTELQPTKIKDDLSFINDLIEEAPKLVLKDTTVEEARKKSYEERDKAELLDNNRDNAVNDDSAVEIEQLNIVSKVNFAFKTIEILGQLLKNYYGSIKSNQKYELAEETYNIGLRTLASFYDFLNQNNDFLIEAIKETIDKKKIVEKAKVEKVSKKIIFEICSLITFGFVKKISNSIGIDKLTETFKELLQNNQFPSYQLIDISIKLDFIKSFPIDDIRMLKNEFTGNTVALNLLRRLVINYIYMFPTTVKMKQQVCGCLEISMDSQRAIDSTSVQKLK
ncbi:MAG: metallophosphoesterase [Pedobacter sp.]